LVQLRLGRRQARSELGLLPTRRNAPDSSYDFDWPVLSVSSLTRGAMQRCASFLPVKDDAPPWSLPASIRGRKRVAADTRSWAIGVETTRSAGVTTRF